MKTTAICPFFVADNAKIILLFLECGTFLCKLIYFILLNGPRPCVGIKICKSVWQKLPTNACLSYAYMRIQNISNKYQKVQEKNAKKIYICECVSFTMTSATIQTTRSPAPACQLNVSTHFELSTTRLRIHTNKKKQHMYVLDGRRQ